MITDRQTKVNYLIAETRQFTDVVTLLKSEGAHLYWVRFPEKGGWGRTIFTLFWPKKIEDSGPSSPLDNYILAVILKPSLTLELGLQNKSRYYLKSIYRRVIQ